MAKKNATLRLDTQDWWAQLGRDKTLPKPLIFLIRFLITCFDKNLIPPEVNPEELRLVKEHLADGLYWGDDHYVVMIFVPTDTKSKRSYFTLIRVPPEGELKRISEC